MFCGPLLPLYHDVNLIKIKPSFKGLYIKILDEPSKRVGEKQKTKKSTKFKFSEE